MLPVDTHYTQFASADEMGGVLDDLIDEFECEALPTEIHRFIALDGSYHDFVVTTLELFMCLSYIYGVEGALLLEE